MKVRCPNCRKILQAPDEWVGKQIKCPGCKRKVTLPGGADPSSDSDLGFDIGSLGSIESAGEAVVFEQRQKMTLKEAQAAAIAAAADATAESLPGKADPTIRVCPQCSRKVRSSDLYSNLMCRHCGGGIPGLELDAGDEKVKYTDSGMKDRIKSQVSFYTGFTSAALYPLPAISDILLGMLIAAAIIAVPVSGVLAFLTASTLNQAVKEEPDLGWVGVFLTFMFIAEAAYFGSVGYYALIDSIRATTAANEQPPGLTWNITKLGAALGGYAALLGFYGVVFLVLLLTSGGGFPPGQQDIANTLGEPINLMILALVTFSVPMSMIGLSSSHALDGLNPSRVGVSIGRLIGHYIFLFLIVLIYLGFYVGIMYAVMNWAGPAIMQAAREGIKSGYLSMLGGIGAWALVMGAGFYFAYSIGRILGLFTRTYREHLEFEI